MVFNIHVHHLDARNTVLQCYRHLTVFNRIKISNTIAYAALLFFIVDVDPPLPFLFSLELWAV